MADEGSIWKKEISFGRKRKAPKDETPAEKMVEPDAEFAPKTSIWKKELSFGRKKAEVTPEPEPVAEPPAPVAELPPAAVAPPAPVAPAPETPVAPVAPAAPETPTIPFANETAGEALGLEQPAQPTQVAPPAPVVPMPATPTERPAEPPRAAGQDELRPRPHLVPVQTTPVDEPPARAETPAPPAPPAPVAAASSSVPAPLPGIHPPVPESDLPPVEGEKTPFWKKQVSVSLKARQPKPPKPPKEPKAAKPPKPAKPPKAPKAERTPFWKKDLSLGRKPKATAETEAPSAPKKPKTPVWKRDLSFKRTPKAERAEKTKGPKKPPIWKREVSLSKPKTKGVATKGNDKLKLVGLKVGASQVAAARVHNNGVPELVQVAREDLEPGIVVGGELRDTDALAETLKLFFRKNKLPKRGVRLGIANNRIGVRTFDVVGIHDPKQLDNAIRFRAQEALPIPIDEAVLDYQILSEFVDDGGQPVKRVLLVVAYRELVDRYVAACKKAGIRLMGIDLEAFALLRALATPKHDGHEGAVVAVAIGSERSTFAVSDGSTCQFTRVLDWGGASLDVAVARALDLTPSQAEPFKRQLSLEPGASDPEGLTPEKADAARQAVRAQLQAFARELVSSLQFYQNQPESLGIGEIVVTGGTAHLPGLASELQRLIGVLVRVGDPLGRVKVGKKVDEGDRIGSLAVAIGLGIED
jgi:type IV pilus assembly protein PilM